MTPSALAREIADVLCCVSQIFNGWRSDEAWTAFDEDTAQRVMALASALQETPDQVAPLEQEVLRLRRLLEESDAKKASEP